MRRWLGEKNHNLKSKHNTTMTQISIKKDLQWQGKTDTQDWSLLSTRSTTKWNESILHVRHFESCLALVVSHFSRGLKRSVT